MYYIVKHFIFENLLANVMAILLQKYLKYIVSVVSCLYMVKSYVC